MMSISTLCCGARYWNGNIESGTCHSRGRNISCNHYEL